MRNLAEALIHNQHGEIMMQRKSHDFEFHPGGCWCLFGGEIEPNESVEQAMYREVMEELGFKPINPELFYSEPYQHQERTGTQNVFRIQRDLILGLTIGEGAGIAFLNKREIELLNPPYHREPIERFYDLVDGK